MNNIYDPVLVRLPLSISFGVIVRIITTTDSEGEKTECGLLRQDTDMIATVAEEDLERLVAPGAYEYGPSKFVYSHPGYKWAMAESERLKNPPVPVSADAPAVAIESHHA